MLACELRRKGTEGPGYATPREAFLLGPREKAIFVTCANTDPSKGDMLAAIDTDPHSETFCQLLSRVDFPNVGDEVHHMGWNACSSCHGNACAKRSHLILPCLNSSRIYIVDALDPKHLKLHKAIEPEALFEHDVSFPHTAHCLADGNIMISTLGTANGSPKANFLLVDSKNFHVVGTWPSNDSEKPQFNYDYWYQPRANIMVSTEWGAPNAIKKGFNPADFKQGHYGNKIHFWDWKMHKLLRTVELKGSHGMVPMEVRFLHDPSSTHGFFATSLGSTIYHFYKKSDGEFAVDEAVSINSKEVSGWVAPSPMPALITDILISMDDKYLYVSCWLHGDIRQYDISDPFKPKLVGQIFIGGSIHKETSVTVTTKGEEPQVSPAPIYLKGKRVEGGPQMLQLSLDGKRLYVSNSLYSVWDKQFYPNMSRSGSVMLQVDVNTEEGGLTLNEDFFVDFGDLKGGPFFAHEMRYPGGDCTSDIWI